MTDATAEKKPYCVDASKYSSTRITSTNESALYAETVSETKTKNHQNFENSQKMNLANDNCSSNGTSNCASDFDVETKREKSLVSKTDNQRTHVLCVIQWETVNAEDYFSDDEWMLLMYEILLDENSM